LALVAVTSFLPVFLLVFLPVLLVVFLLDLPVLLVLVAYKTPLST
jgi:hypothetical protein